MMDAMARVRAALRERGIASPEAFAERYGVPLHTLSPSAALALMETPAWVTDIWLPNAGPTPVVWVPMAVRQYAAVFGLSQCDDESDHDFNRRIREGVPAGGARAGALAQPWRTHGATGHSSASKRR